MADTGFYSKEVDKIAKLLNMFFNEEQGNKLTAFAIKGIVAELNTYLQELDRKIKTLETTKE